MFGAVSQDDDSVPISWTEPTATDDISEPELFLRTRRPGDQFSIGSTTVIYYVRDAAGNIAGCSFQVSVVQSEYVILLKRGELLNMQNLVLLLHVDN